MSAYDPAKHHRRSIRLKGHDYAGGGVYFVTLCAHRDAGSIFEHEGAKEILGRIWEEIAREAQSQGAKEGRTPGAPVRAGLVSAPAPALLAYCIMPDHFHGLIRIEKGEKALGDLLCAFKSRTTLEYIRGVKAGVFPPFKDKIWHRNYYEMIVRSPEAEQKITQYIRLNPWRCVQALGSGLRGMGNIALWQADKLGVLCSRNAPDPSSIPGAAVYLSGFHSPMEQEIMTRLLAAKRNIIWCPAWGINAKTLSPEALIALEENRMLILEMKDTEGNLAAAEARNCFVIQRADRMWTPHVTPGGMLERILKDESHTKARKTRSGAE